MQVADESSHVARDLQNPTAEAAIALAMRSICAYDGLDMPPVSARVLICTKNPAELRSILDDDFVVTFTESGKEVVEFTRTYQPIAIVIESLTDMSHGELCREIRRSSSTAIFLINEQPTPQTVIEVSKYPGVQVLDSVQLKRRIDDVANENLNPNLLNLPSGVISHSSGPNLVGTSIAFREVLQMVGRCSQVDDPVLIEGEIGTGKSEIARAIHFHSDFVETIREFDCLADAEEIVAFFAEHAARSEGAQSNSAQVNGVQADEKCTVVLHEIDQASRKIQNTLIRYFEKPTPMRLIATTSVPFVQLRLDETFRDELCYALGVVRIALPALRDRLDDLPKLVACFVQQIKPESSASISPDAMETLEAYSWPGNLDELRASLREAIFNATTGSIPATSRTNELQITAAHLPSLSEIENSIPAVLTAAGATNWDEFVETRITSEVEDLYAQSVAEMESMVLQRVMRATGGNQTKAARLLGITRGNLRKKIRALGLTVQRVVTTHESEDVDEHQS